MITLESIIQAEFEESDVDEIVSILSSHGFYSQITIGINLVNKHLGQSKQEIKIFGTVPTGHLVAGLLIKTNEYLRTLKDDEKKVELGNIVGGIYRQFLKQIIDLLPVKNRPLFGLTVYLALEETCELCNYNFEKLLGVLGILESASTQAASIIAEDTKPNLKVSVGVPGYVWAGNPKLFQPFLDLVEKLGITADIKGFEALFESPLEGLQLELNRKRCNYVLQFFAYLNDNKIIGSHGRGYGFYQVLQFHVNAFDEAFLRYHVAFRRVEGVKRLVNWPINQNRFEIEMKKLLKRDI